MGDSQRTIAHRVAFPDQILWTVSRLTQVPETMFASLLTSADAVHMRHESFPVDHPDRDLTAIGQPVIVRQTAGGTTTVLLTDGGLALVEIWGGSASVEVAGADRATVDMIVKTLSHCLGASSDDPGLVPIDFWAEHGGATRSARRRVPAPTWHEIQHNYELSTATAIAELLGCPRPGAGRLILWHGPPGTGKTHVLRALSREWRSWCSMHVITDPEAFLGAGTSYLLDVLTTQDRRHANARESWKLIVLEDAGELLTEDAHTRAGQALSRLLNVTDGMLGQGMNTIVLVSTNEPLGKLHPAIRRAGRCWSQIEFEPLSAGAANKWLAGSGTDVRVASPTTLADLYAITRGEQIDQPRLFGFAAAV